MTTTTTENFFEATAAVFDICETPDRTPDFVSGSGSAYWYENGGVVRCSDHWGYGIASCNWWIRGLDMIHHQSADAFNLIEAFGTDRVSAFCKFDNFRDVDEFGAEFEAVKREVGFKVNSLF